MRENTIIHFPRKPLAVVVDLLDLQATQVFNEGLESSYQRTPGKKSRKIQVVGTEDGGELRACRTLAALFSRLADKEGFGSTSPPFHLMTDSLPNMENRTPVNFSVT